MINERGEYISTQVCVRISAPPHSSMLQLLSPPSSSIARFSLFPPDQRQAYNASHARVCIRQSTALPDTTRNHAHPSVKQRQAQHIVVWICIVLPSGSRAALNVLCLLLVICHNLCQSPFLPQP